MSNVFYLNLSDDTVSELPQPDEIAHQCGRGVVVQGELDVASVDQLRTAASAAYRAVPDNPGAPTFVVDMAGVTFIDSSGLHALNEILRQVESRAWSVELLAPTASGPRRLLRFAATHGWLTARASHRPVDSARWGF